MTSLRKRTFEILEAAKEEDPASRVCDAFLIVLISLNVIAVILESVSSLAETYGDSFYAFEVFSVAVFTIEYLARVWVSVERREAATSSGLRCRRQP